MTHATGTRSLRDALAAERADDSIAGIARVALSERDPRVECPRYMTALTQVIASEAPAFGSPTYEEVYRSAAVNGQWLAVSLITNSSGEGDGARRLWSLAACAPNDHERQLLKRHAVDESRHALAYLSLLDLAFPGAVEPAFRAQLNDLSPHWTMAKEVFPVEGSPYARKPTIDDYIQMNISEMRTTIHHTLQREALALHCPEEHQDRITAILDSLLRDELNHVCYTAELIEEKAAAMDEAKFHALFAKRMHDFSDITREELGQLKFE